MNSEDRINRMQAAKELASNPLLIDILRGMKDKHLQGLLSELPGSQKAMKHHGVLTAVDEIEKSLASMVNDEKFMKKAGIL